MTAPRDTALSLWTIYQNPSDYPGMYVAREFRVRSDGSVVAAQHVTASRDIEVVRSEMMKRGLTCLRRNDGDDPVIVETWI